MRQVKIYRPLVILLAVTFVLSAWLYCLATMYTARNVADTTSEDAPGLIVLFRDRGVEVLVAELVMLAVATVLLMRADRSKTPVPHRTDACERLAENQQQHQSTAQDHDD